MLNWQLEGSCDRMNWYVIDKRVHLFDDPEKDKKIEKQRKILIQKGSTNSFGVDEDEVLKYPKGFQCFRIMQTTKNSSGSYNLSLSGLELYGCPMGNNWVM